MGWRILVWAMATLLPFVAIAEKPRLIATNATPELLHTIDDYLRDLPPETLTDELRREVFAKATVNEVRDAALGKSDYEFKNTFLSPGFVALSARLMIVENETAARQFAAGALDGFRKTVESAGNTLDSIEGLDGFYPGSHFLIVGNKAQGPAGNCFIVQKGPNVYMLTVAGGGHFADAANVQAFLEPKLAAIMSFTPEVPALVRETEQRKERDKRESDKNAITVVLIFYDLVGFVAGFLLGWIINLVARRPIVSRFAFGLAGIVAVVIFFWRICAQVIEKRAAEGIPFSSFEVGEKYGTVLGPALLAVGLAYLVRKVYHSTRPRPKTARASVDGTPPAV